MHSCILSHSDPLVDDDLSMHYAVISWMTGEHLNSSFCSMLTWSVFQPSLLEFVALDKSFCTLFCFNTCKCKHSHCSVLQGFFFLLFCSALSSFILHLDPNAVNISTVVRLAPFIINRSPSAAKERNFKNSKSKPQLLQRAVVFCIHKSKYPVHLVWLEGSPLTTKSYYATNKYIKVHWMSL